MASTLRTALLVSLAFASPLAASAQTPAARLSDKDVKTLIDQVDEGRDKFEGNLDGKFKGAQPCGARPARRRSRRSSRTIRTTPRSSRIDSPPDYSASAEVATVLKQSTAIDTFMEGAASVDEGPQRMGPSGTAISSASRARTGPRFPCRMGPPSAG